MVNKKNLHLFTDSFPFDSSSEGAFILPEIAFTNKEFDYIYIYALKQEGKVTFSLPENVKVIYFNFNKQTKLPLPLKFKILFKAVKESLTHKEFREFKIFKFLYSQLKSYYKKGIYISPILNQNLNKKDLIYSYWLAEWDHILCSLKSRNKLKNTLISRAHGFDLYNDRNSLKRIPFRATQLKYTTFIYCISNDGNKYLKKHYPTYRDQIATAKLGVFEKGINPKLKKDFILVSCSTLASVKRIPLIVEILKNIKHPIKWVHFGDGKSMKELKNSLSVLPNNVKIELKGFVTNKEIIEYYNSIPINLFINVSSSEGIPVSIMEAISFGIPAISYNVGGLSEIISNKTGRLFNDSNDIVEITNFIQNFPNSHYNTTEFREKVKVFWNNEFNARKNYSDFAQKISKL